MTNERHDPDRRLGAGQRLRRRRGGRARARPRGGATRLAGNWSIASLECAPHLAAPVAPPLGAGDAAIAAALGALDRPACSGAHPAAVPSLDHRRRRRMQWFAGAAAAAVIALLVGLVIRSGDDDGSTAVSKAPATTNGAVASRTETRERGHGCRHACGRRQPECGGAATAPASTAAPGAHRRSTSPASCSISWLAGDRPTCGRRHRLHRARRGRPGHDHVPRHAGGGDVRRRCARPPGTLAGRLCRARRDRCDIMSRCARSCCV